MTVSSTINKSGPYIGNGSTVNFDYEFRILDMAHLIVVKTVGGVETLLTLADYAVTGVGALAGGSIILNVAPVTGETITIIPNPPFTQQIDLENQGAYYAETVERGLDLAAMRDQKLAEGLERAIQIPVSADASALNDVIAGVLRLADSADAVDVVAGIAANVTAVAAIEAEILAVPAQVGAAEAAAITSAGRAELATEKADLATTEADRAASYVPNGVAKSISGLVISNNVGTPTTRFDVSSGAGRDKNNLIDIVLVSSLAKSISANWAAGANNGCLDTGAVAAYTAYHVFVIRNPTTSVVDLLASTSPTAPLMPAGFTQRRRIGIIQTNDLAQIYQGTWRANGEFEYKSAITVATDMALTSIQLAIVLNNCGIKRLWKGRMLLDNVGADFWLIARDPDVGVPTASDLACFKPTETRFGNFIGSIWTDAVGRIYVGSNNNSASNKVTIVTSGWLDLRDEYV